MTTPYTTFASIYESTMALDYWPWVNYIMKAYKKHVGKKPSSLLDLGCGTGGLTSLFQVKRKVGVDISPDMIREAELNDKTTEYICQDIRNLQLDETFDLIISTHDTLNYIIDEGDLLQTFYGIRNRLKTGGIFIGDITSEYNILKNFDTNVFEEVHDNILMIWENNYNRNEKLLTSRLRFYEEDRKHINGNNNKKHLQHTISKSKLINEEIHLQRYYSREKFNRLLSKAGFSVIASGSDYDNWQESSKASLMISMAKK